MENIVCKGLTKNYAGKNVVDHVDLTLEKGKIYGLIGRNGAGKTTLLSMITAQTPASTGDSYWNDERIWENENALSHICFAREINASGSSNPYAALKVKEYLQMASWHYANWDQEMADKLLNKFKLDPKQKLSKLSKGMLSMVTIIVAMASKADFTFLDEPVAGIDVVMREYFYRLLIDEYTQTGRTFVVSTHIIEEASDYFEEVLIINEGELMLKENTQDLLERAYQINGLEQVVDEATKKLTCYHTRKNGRSKTVTVLLEDGEQIPDGYDLTVRKLNLQNLFVALCGEEDL